MKNLTFNLSMFALLLGLTGSVLLFCYGLPSKVKSEETMNLVTEGPAENVSEIKISNKQITRRAHTGIGLIGACFFIQFTVVILERIYTKQ